MCGLAGAFSWSDTAPPPREDDVVAARDRMWRRGQDGEGLWVSADRRIIFGHRRLAVIDPDPRSRQPMRRGSLTIIFNGEIYNYRALREELERTGERLETEGDAEVILAMYRRHGPAAVERLRGMFAFAIADERARTLFLARDQFGMKPLYYADQSGVFHFASQVQALRLMGGLSTTIDPAGLVGFHLMGSVPEPFTIFRSMRCLEAGHHLTVGATGPATPVRYANVAAELADATPDDASDMAAVIGGAMQDSVRAHLVADVEVGLLLSAGIDSGALLGLMRDCGADGVRTFTLEFAELRGTAADEVPVARETARRYGAEHHVETVGAGEFDRCAEDIFRDMDQPTVDGINTWFATRLAARTGLKVVLSGVGADELLGGYHYFDRVPRMRRAVSAVRSVPVAAQLARWALRRFGPVVAHRNPKLAGVLDHGATLPGSYLVNRAILLPFELGDVLDADTVREGLERLQPIGRIASTLDPDPGSDQARMIALDTSSFLRNQLLRDGDWASMAHTVELRMPFVDWPTLRRIAPVAHRLTRRAGKMALAAAPQRPLPQSVTTRPPSGFNVPIGPWTGGAAALDRLTSRRWAPQVIRRLGLS